MSVYEPAKSAKLDDDTLDVLQGLIGINIDSYKGWQDVAAHCKDSTLKNFFERMGQSRRRNANELESIVGANGEKINDHGTFSGQMHRWWIDAKQSLNGNSVDSILNEAERGEDSIRREYEHHLEEIVSSPAADIVRRQYDSIRTDHNEVKRLRDRYRNPA